MLVLTRGVGEEIIIDGDIRVTVVGLKGDRVRIGIEAPPAVTVDRREIHERRLHFARDRKPVEAAKTTTISTRPS